jgi:hypothetical protein
VPLSFNVVIFVAGKAFKAAHDVHMGKINNAAMYEFYYAIL